MLGLYRESRAPVPVDLKEILEDILILMEHRFHELNVSVQTDLPEKVIVDAFPAELRQVFTNLIANAPKPPAPAASFMSASKSSAPPDKLPAGASVVITDNGPGIPEEILSQLFQPFFTTKGEQGTGLGLWVSRGIITKHGGSIDITSDTTASSHGTIVTVFLAEKPTIAASSGLTDALKDLQQRGYDLPQPLRSPSGSHHSASQNARCEARSRSQAHLSASTPRRNAAASPSPRRWKITMFVCTASRSISALAVLATASASNRAFA